MTRDIEKKNTEEERKTTRKKNLEREREIEISNRENIERNVKPICFLSGGLNNGKLACLETATGVCAVHRRFRRNGLTVNREHLTGIMQQ